MSPHPLLKVYLQPTDSRVLESLRLLSEAYGFLISDDSADDADLLLLASPEFAASSKAPFFLMGQESISPKDDRFLGRLSISSTEEEWKSSLLGALFNIAQCRLAAQSSLAQQKKELRLSKEKYKTLVSSIDCIVWELDAKTLRFRFVSDVAVRILGYSLEEWFEEGFWERNLHPEDRQRAYATSLESIRAGKDHRISYRMIAKDGRVLWFDDLARVFSEDGVPSIVRGIQIDITEKKDTEANLEALNLRARLAAESAKLGIWEYDQDSNCVSWDDGMYALFGLTIGDPITLERWVEMIHPEDRDHSLNTFLKAVSLFEENYETRFRITRADGDFRYIQAFARRFRKPSGDGYRWVGTNHDLTDVWVAEQKLKEREALFRAIAEQTPCGLILMDLEDKEIPGRILYTNEFFAQERGYTVDELIDKSVAIIDSVEDMKKLPRRLRQVLEENRSAFKMTHCHKDGWSFPVEVVVQKIPAIGNGVAIALTTNLTARLRAETEKREMEKRLYHTQKLESLGVLAGGIAHDFNNILQAIILHNDMLIDQLDSKSTCHNEAQKIATAAHRAAELCEQMLAYSGKGTFHMNTFDVTQAIEEISHLLKVSISKKARLNIHQMEDDLWIHADKTQFRQIMMNLITNASEALGEDPGDIEITMDKFIADPQLNRTDVANLPPGPYVCVAVRDTGIGMNKETQQKIFEPFFTTKFTGRGLGMASVIGILRSHNGGIQVSSTPGKGSTIKIYFPAVQKVVEEAQEVTPDSERKECKASATVLIADDEAIVLHVSRMLLERAGFQIITASNGVEAVEVFRSKKMEIDLVILDITMPELDGYAALDMIREVKPSMPVILTSGYSESESNQSLRAPKTRFLMKPYRGKELVSTVNDLLSTTP